MNNDIFKSNLSDAKFLTPEEYADKLFDHLNKDKVKLIRLSATMWLIPNTDKLVKEIIIREKISNRNLECFYSKFEERLESKLKNLFVARNPFDDTSSHFSNEGICLIYYGLIK